MMMARARQGRAVVLVNALISVGIVAAIAGASVFRKPPAPPSIAEFAPANPAQQLAVEPSPLAARNGSKSLPVGPLPTPPQADGVPSTLQCWGWPDGSTTQTFDRQSPPCISSWAAAAGNGGATSSGVTHTEVRVGVPAAAVAAWQPYADFFSRHYQLYGRTLRLVPIGLQNFKTAEGQRAAAVSAAEQSVFAALDVPGAANDALPDLGVYLDTLADVQVLGVLTGATQISTTAMSAQAPYVWSRQPAMDTTQRTLATAICRELSGGRAVHAEQTEGQTRRLAVLVPAANNNAGRTFDATSLVSALERCHLSVQVREYDAGDRPGLEQLLSDERRGSTTTLVPFGGASVVAGRLMAAAQRVDFRPEWLIPGLAHQQSASAWAEAPPEQVKTLFGIASWSPPLPAHSTPAAQALHEVAPSAEFGVEEQAMYDGLSLIAAGVQMAGPGLTAQSFADGLESTTFANPEAGAAPAYQARVGFADVDHSMVDDFAQFWWRGDQFCMIGAGRRWTADELPFSDPGFFDPSAGC